MTALEGSIQIWSQAAATWTADNPVLLVGQFGFETDTNKLKIGDGSTAWTSLAYISPPETTTTAGALINGATDKAIPVDADYVGLMDSAASNVLKKLSWANIKATLKTYFDSLTTTLTNKRITPRVLSAASYTTDTGTSLDCDALDAFFVTAQAGALLFNNPSGTPTDGQAMIIRVKDNGTARALTYGSQFRAVGVTAPTTTVINKTTYIGIIWNAAATKWDIIGVSTEA